MNKEGDLLRLESKLSHEINKLKDLESKINAQSLEIEESVKIGELKSNCLSLSGTEASLGIKQGAEKDLDDEDIEKKMKIECKSEIIQVLKEGLRGIFEIRMEANKEMNEMRKEIVETLHVDFNLNCREEAECIDDEAEWIKIQIQRITDQAMRDFELYIDVISK